MKEEQKDIFVNENDLDNKFLNYEMRKQKLCFFVMGLINNFVYVVVLSASDSLSKDLDAAKYMSLFSVSLVLFSAIIRVINSRYLVKIVHRIRIIMSLTLTIIGIIVMIYSVYCKIFFFCLLGSTFIGLGCSLGDSTLQGFLKGFDPRVLVGYSSGTGFAGVFGALYYFVMTALEIENQYILAILVFFSIAYYFTFIKLLSLKTTLDHFMANKELMNRTLSEDIDELEEQEKNSIKTEKNTMENKEAQMNQNLGLNNFCKIFSKISFFTVNLGLVYFLEYGCITYLASIASGNIPNKETFFEKESFQILQILYQIGVFLSRSSLDLFQIKKVHYITFFQFCFFLIWVFIAITSFTNIWVFFVIMLLVGIAGGTSYVNCIFNILNSNEIHKSEMEIATTLNSIYIDLNILTSGLIGIIFKSFEK